jgi:aspartate-semialdehyde dehydrogenase
MKLGIVGITGLVGENVLKSLDLLEVKYDELYLFGSSSIGLKRIYNDKEYEIMEFDNKYLNELDYIILCVDNDIAKEIITHHRENKCTSVIIDNSSEYRLDENVPLVIPEVNGDTLKGQKIIANPNCSTTLLVMLLKPLLDLAAINKVVVSTYQAASGAGKKGYDELVQQVFDYAQGDKITTKYWGKQYLFNVFSHNSQINLDTKYNQEEMKIIHETHKILNNYEIKINPTCVRVPTLRSHCLSVNVQFSKELNFDQIVKSLENFSGIKIVNNEEANEFPEPIHCSKSPYIYVGRIRPETGGNYIDYTNWSFFVCGDQLLKGAAYNSVQILQKC